jgi:selenocysteine lyase/cysteine desulfurase
MHELESLLKKYNPLENPGENRVRMVAISGASNVLGVCNNLPEISRIAHAYGAQVLVDAAQLIAHRPVDLKACGADYLAFSAHKVYAPFGCGVLVARKGLLKFSESEGELIRTSGEENVAGIAALGKMLVLLRRIGMDHIREEEQDLTARALRALAQIPGLKVYGISGREHPEFGRKVGVVVFALKGMMSNRVAEQLSLHHGIGVRYGCHCAHIIIKRMLGISPGLEKFQRVFLTLFPKMSLPGLTRISLGLENNGDEIDKLVYALNKINKTPGELAAGKGSENHPFPKSEVQKQIADFISNTTQNVYSSAYL